MSTFSPTDAALEGVRLGRERPRAILIWAASSFAFTLFLSMVADVTLGSQAQALLSEARQSTADPAEFDDLVSRLWPFIVVGFPLWMGFQAMLTAALYRLVLDPEHRKFGLKLGGDELRLLALGMIQTLIGLAISFVGLFTGLVAGVGAGPVAAFLGMIAKVALLCIGLVVWVRLSLAAPATCAQGRLIVLQSWSMTKGQFWRLLGSYTLAFAIGAVVFVVSLVSMIVVFGILLAVLRISSAGLSAHTPAVWIVGVLAQAAFCLAIICFRVITVAPAAEAYRELVASGA
jgi:hypothetical protein